MLCLIVCLIPAFGICYPTDLMYFQIFQTLDSEDAKEQEQVPVASKEAPRLPQQIQGENEGHEEEAGAGREQGAEEKQIPVPRQREEPVQVT